MIRFLRLVLAFAAQTYPVEAVEKVHFALGIWDLNGYKGRLHRLLGRSIARYKHYDLNQTKMIPLSYADQIVEGSFEYALNEIVEEHLDLSVFEHRYGNDDTGRSAYDPPSRASERLSDNVVFLSRNQQRTGFSVESFTGVEGGACACLASGFFYGLVGRTAETTRSWLAVWGTTTKARDCDVKQAQSCHKVAASCAYPPLWYFFGVSRSALAQDTTVARTIRFPASLRERITSDAERCGRSFEGQVLALLRRHYGENVDIAPSPNDILALATASLADVPVADAGALVRRLKEAER